MEYRQDSDWNNATDLNCAAGGKFQSFLAKRAQNNREIDPKLSKRACAFQVSVQTRQHFLVLSYVLRCEWLPERASLDGTSCPLETTHRIPQEKFARSHVINHLLTKFVRSRWLDIVLVLCLRVYGRDSVSVHKHAKKNLANNQLCCIGLTIGQ